MKKQITYGAYAVVSLVVIFAMGKTLMTVATVLPTTVSTDGKNNSFSEVIRSSQQPTAQILEDEQKESALHGSAPEESSSGELFPELNTVRPDSEEQLQAKGYK